MFGLTKREKTERRIWEAYKLLAAQAHQAHELAIELACETDRPQDEINELGRDYKIKLGWLYSDARRIVAGFDRAKEEGR